MANYIFYDPKSESFDKKITGNYVNLACSTLGATIVSCSDEFFAAAENLLKPAKPIFCFGKFTEQGQWMDGWETRRHNPDHDWVIIELAFSGTIAGFGIDTTHFNGNQAPVVSVDACNVSENGKECDYQWEEILPKVSLNATSEHVFMLKQPTNKSFNCIRLNNYPDGGIARFKVFGNIIPNWPKDRSQIVDLAFIGNGGRVISCSNEHYNTKDNLIYPGRGVNMGDGWETRRSRVPNHSDWVIVKLGAPGLIKSVDIDTNNYKGNYPKNAKIEGCFSTQDDPSNDSNANWVELLPLTKLGPHQQHLLDTNKVESPLSHVRLTIYPDGGVKRLRVYGCRY